MTRHINTHAQTKVSGHRPNATPRLLKPTTAISLGLFAAWAVHDAEELVTMAPTSRRVFRQLPDFLPIPQSLRARGLSQKHVNVSLGLMAVPVALSAAAGVKTNGKSPWFRGGLLAFGVHGFAHVLSSVATRSYTTGVATAPVVALPYWFIAGRVLQQHGISGSTRTVAATALAAIPLTVGVHLISAALLREGSLGPARERDNRFTPRRPNQC